MCVSHFSRNCRDAGFGLERVEPRAVGWGEVCLETRQGWQKGGVCVCSRGRRGGDIGLAGVLEGKSGEGRVSTPLSETAVQVVGCPVPRVWDWAVGEQQLHLVRDSWGQDPSARPHSLCIGVLISSLWNFSDDLGWPQKEDCYWNRIFYRSQSSQAAARSVGLLSKF